MKIAIITNLCTHYRYKLFKTLSEQHHYDFYFFEDEYKTKEEVKHLTIFKKGKRFYNLPISMILYNLFKYKYDVIIKCTNNKWSFIGCLFIAKLLKSRFIVWNSLWFFPKSYKKKIYYWLFEKILKNYSDGIIVYGSHAKKFLINKGVDQRKIFIAWQTVDNDLFGREVKEQEIENVKSSFDLPKDKKIILFVGRISEVKGIRYLLNSLNVLNKNKFIFMTIGYGELENHVIKYCNENGILHRHIGLIPNNNLPPFYKLASVLVLPSITSGTFKEPWGLVVNEAFNQGCPVIVTDSVGAGAGGLVRNAVNGFIVPEKNVDDLSKAIRRLIIDSELRNYMSNNAIMEIGKWTFERQIDGFLDAVNYVFK